MNNTGHDISQILQDLRLHIPPDYEAIETGLAGATPAPPEILDRLKEIFDLRIADSEPATDLARYLTLIVAVSALLTCVRGAYAGRRYAPALYMAVVGEAGSNKSVISIGRRALLKAHHRRKKASAAEQVVRGGLPVGIIVPADISAAALRHAFRDAAKGVFVWAPEIDAMVAGKGEAWKDTSAVERQAFEHEPIEIRRAGEEVIVSDPVLAMVVAGTPRAHVRDLPTTEDGRFSRRIWIITPSIPEWISPKPSTKLSHYEQNVSLLADRFDKLAEKAEEVGGTIEFELTDEQWETFDAFFSQLKAELIVSAQADLYGIVHRLGVIAFRIAMVIASLRRYLKTPDLMTADACLRVADEDLTLALALATLSLDHAMRVRELLPGTRDSRRSSGSGAHQLLGILPDSFQRGEAVEIAGRQLGRRTRTTDKYLRILLEDGSLTRGSYGSYIKVQPSQPHSDPVAHTSSDDNDDSNG